MGELSIKVKIANRLYPMTIEMSEEEGIRKAVDAINRSMQEFERLYAVKDKQDLLAMAALKLASKNAEMEEKAIMGNDSIEEDLINVEQMFDEYL